MIKFHSRGTDVFLCETRSLECFGWIRIRRNMDSKVETDVEDCGTWVVEWLSSEIHKYSTFDTSHQFAIFRSHSDEKRCFSVRWDLKLKTQLQTRVSEFMTCNSEFELDEWGSCESKLVSGAESQSSYGILTLNSSWWKGSFQGLEFLGFLQGCRISYSISF